MSVSAAAMSDGQRERTPARAAAARPGSCDTPMACTTRPIRSARQSRWRYHAALAAQLHAGDEQKRQRHVSSAKLRVDADAALKRDVAAGADRDPGAAALAHDAHRENHEQKRKQRRIEGHDAREP